jgi:hypothetical protein
MTASSLPDPCPFDDRLAHLRAMSEADLAAAHPDLAVLPPVAVPVIKTQPTHLPDGGAAGLADA